MKVDIAGWDGQFTVRNTETQEVIDVKSVNLYLNKDGQCEAILYVGVGRISLDSVSRATDGVREEGKAYERH